MRTVVFGDVHANLPALEAMLKHAGPADRFVCLGDVVNYGPWGDECVDLVESLPNCDRLMGNHDEAFLAGSYPGSNPLVQAFFRHCFPRFRRQAALRSYAEKTVWENYEARHTVGGKYVFPDTPLRLDRNYIIGHSHHQFRRESDGFVLYNAGSVGQNRRFINVVSYLVCGPGPDQVESINFTYDVDVVLAAMEGADYPRECIDYYRTKPRA